MTTTFDAWLRHLAAVGRRLPDNQIAIVRGLPFEQTIRMQGNWTGATMTASLRLDPDAPGATLADFTIAGPVHDAASDRSAFTLSLTKAQTGAVPADNDGDALVQLAIDILFKPAGGTQARLLGGVATVSGKVTDAL